MIKWIKAPDSEISLEIKHIENLPYNYELLIINIWAVFQYLVRCLAVYIDRSLHTLHIDNKLYFYLSANK